jgi:RNA polymerase sigma factor (sigma-70 family)
MTSTFTNLTDLEIIEKWNGNIHSRTRANIEAYFYKKYQPLCRVISHRYKSVSTYEDNMQECYLIMLKALEYINPNKVTNQAAFSFGSIFKQYLTAYFNCNCYESFNSKCEKEEVSIYYDKMEQNESEESFIIDLQTESFEETTIFSDIVNAFKKTLKDTEIRLWNLLEEGKTQKEIASLINKTSISYNVQKLKNRYIDFMNKNGYAIEI